MQINEVIDIIEGNPQIYELLKYCPYEILKQWQVKNYRKSMFRLNQGQVYDVLYIVVDGSVDIYVMSESGKKYSLSIYTTGNLIGEHEIFERKPFSCFVEANSDVKLLELKREYFLRWIAQDRNISEKITQILCRQIYILSKKAGKDNLYSLKKRVCEYFVRNLVPNSKNNFKVYIDKEKLSEQMAVTQRSINRVIKELREKNIVEVGGNYIIIKNLKLLKSQI